MMSRCRASMCDRESAPPLSALHAGRRNEPQVRGRRRHEQASPAARHPWLPLLHSQPACPRSAHGRRAQPRLHLRIESLMSDSLASSFSMSPALVCSSCGRVGGRATERGHASSDGAATPERNSSGVAHAATTQHATTKACCLMQSQRCRLLPAAVPGSPQHPTASPRLAAAAARGTTCLVCGQPALAAAPIAVLEAAAQLAVGCHFDVQLALQLACLAGRGAENSAVRRRQRRNRPPPQPPRTSRRSSSHAFCADSVAIGLFGGVMGLRWSRWARSAKRTTPGACGVVPACGRETHCAYAVATRWPTGGCSEVSSVEGSDIARACSAASVRGGRLLGSLTGEEWDGQAAGSCSCSPPPAARAGRTARTMPPSAGWPHPDTNELVQEKPRQREEAGQPEGCKGQEGREQCWGGRRASGRRASGSGERQMAAWRWIQACACLAYSARRGSARSLAAARETGRPGGFTCRAALPAAL